MKKQKKNLIVTLADENYIDQAKQLFSSVYWNAGWKGDYMLLAHEIPEKKLKWFRDKGILVKKCKPVYSKSKLKKLYDESSADKNEFTLNYLSVILCKFYLFTIYFKKWKNIIYLDADIIVRASLDELAKIKGFAAVHDTSSPRLKDQVIFSVDNEFLFNKPKEGYNLNENAFNAGVIAFSTGIITKDTFFELKKLLERCNKISKFNEQPILNLFFYKKWIGLPLIYNFNPCFTSFPFFNKNKAKGIIFHFFGKQKPWFSDDPFYEEWKDNLEKDKLINLKKIQKVKKWSKKEIKKKSKYYARIIFIWLPIRDIRNINRIIGAIGIFLSKHWPRLYLSLKKI